MNPSLMTADRMFPAFRLRDLVTAEFQRPDFVTQHFLSDLVGIIAVTVTTAIVLWLPAILQPI